MSKSNVIVNMYPKKDQYGGYIIEYKTPISSGKASFDAQDEKKMLKFMKLLRKQGSKNYGKCKRTRVH